MFRVYNNYINQQHKVTDMTHTEQNQLSQAQGVSVNTLDNFKCPMAEYVVMNYRLIKHTNHIRLVIFPTITQTYEKIASELKFMLECQSKGLVESFKDAYGNFNFVYDFS